MHINYMSLASNCSWFDQFFGWQCHEVSPHLNALKGVVNCQNSGEKGPPEGNSARG